MSSMSPWALQDRQTENNMEESHGYWHNWRRVTHLKCSSANSKYKTRCHISYSHYAPQFCVLTEYSPSWLTNSFGLLSKAILKSDLRAILAANLWSGFPFFLFFLFFWCWGCSHTRLACIPLLSYSHSHMAFPSFILKSDIAWFTYNSNILRKEIFLQIQGF